MTTNVVTEIIPHIYQAHDIPSIIDNYLLNVPKSIREDSQFLNFCNELTYFRSLILDEQKVNHPKDLDDLYEAIFSHYPNTLFEFTMRRKAFIKFLSKCCLFYNTNRSIAQVQDIKGCKIVIYNEDPIIGASLCYDIITYIIKFLTVFKGYNLCLAQPLISTEKFNPKDFPNIYVPKVSELPLEYQPYVKDYIMSPKATTGYQSIHTILLDRNENPIEFQVKTNKMDILSLSGPASHDVHNELRYKNNNIEKMIDISKIQIEGFAAKEDIIIKDAVGLFEAKNLFERYRLF